MTKSCLGLSIQRVDCICRELVEKSAQPGTQPKLEIDGVEVDPFGIKAFCIYLFSSPRVLNEDDYDTLTSPKPD